MKVLLRLQAFILIIYACATPGNPVGGEKDEEPPKLISSSPADQSINVDTKEITLEFNEWLKEENFKEQLIVTPRTTNEYKYIIRKNTVVIEFENELQDSTTYTFNFRNAIGDITEQNKWQEPIIAFSTGDFLDSLSISGTTKDILQNKTTSNVTVALYDICDTCNLRQGLPVYLTQTNEEGEYMLQNIKNSKYRLYAFNDINNNLLNESAKESFGFWYEPITLDSNIQDLEILMYKSNQDTLKLNNAKPSKSNFQISYNKGLQKYNLITLKDSLQVFASLDNTATKITIFRDNLQKEDTLQTLVSVTDTLGTTRTDTISAYFRASSVPNDSLQITNKRGQEYTNNSVDLFFQFNKPIIQHKTDSIFVLYDTAIINSSDQITIQTDSTSTQFHASIELSSTKLQNVIRTIDSTSMVLDSLAQRQESDTTDTATTNGQQNTNVDESDSTSSTQHPFSSVKGLTFYAIQGSFISIDNDTLSNINIALKQLEPENYGIIRGSVDSTSNQFIIQLVDTKYKVVDEIFNQKNFTFTYVKPGTYFLRLVIDTNQNGQWDPGNPLTDRKAEDVIFLNEELIVKANWEIVDKKLSVDNHKNKEEKDVKNNTVIQNEKSVLDMDQN